jgi:hypothetical protein
MKLMIQSDTKMKKILIIIGLLFVLSAAQIMAADANVFVIWDENPREVHLNVPEGENPVFHVTVERLNGAPPLVVDVSLFEGGNFIERFDRSVVDRDIPNTDYVFSGSVDTAGRLSQNLRVVVNVANQGGDDNPIEDEIALTVLNQICPDVDGDGICNQDDPNPNDGPLGDIDGDGFNNEDDNCPNHVNPDQTDADNDGVGDACEMDQIVFCFDVDHDGICDRDDMCPMDPFNDFDNDGLCANVDGDDDGDGVLDEDDSCFLGNDNFDDDGDGIPNFCDPNNNDGPLGDLDGDGVPNENDVCPGGNDNIDNNRNGLPDDCEVDFILEADRSDYQLLEAVDSVRFILDVKGVPRERVTFSMDDVDENCNIYASAVDRGVCALRNLFNSVPEEFEFNERRGEFSFAPGYDFIEHPVLEREFTLTFIGVDNQGRESNEFDVNLSIADNNRNPEFEVVANREARVGEQIAFEVSASDADGDDLNYGLAGNFGVLANQEFSVTPQEGDEGVHELVFIVHDDFGGQAQMSVNINVLCADANNDGICDNDPQCINDRDNDGICDAQDMCPLDPDNDLDGDLICGDVDECPQDEFNDLDGDGVCGNVDMCPGADDRIDVNNNGVPDCMEQQCPLGDADNDGVCDNVDNCPLIANNQVDSDRDGNGDACDICQGKDIAGDSDNDGFCDDIDLCPFDPDPRNQCVVFPQPINHAPVILSDPVENARDGESYVYEVVARDADNDPLTFILERAPAGMSIDRRGRIQFEPEHPDSYIVIVAVSDGRLVVRQQYVLVVSQGKENVELSRVRVFPEFVRAGEYITVQVTSDNEGRVDVDDLRVRVIIPEFGILQASSEFELADGQMDGRGVVIQIPPYAQEGYHIIKVILTADSFHRTQFREVYVLG